MVHSQLLLLRICIYWEAALHERRWCAQWFHPAARQRSDASRVWTSAVQQQKERKNYALGRELRKGMVRRMVRKPAPTP